MMAARTAFLVLTSITSISWCSGIAIAQESVEREIVIAEQALPDSLKLVADEFGLQLAFFSEVAEGVEAPALNGTYTKDQALDVLLAGTRLEYDYMGYDTVVVRAAATPDRQERSSNLGNPAPTPRLMAQASANQVTTSQNNSRNEAATSIISGRVTDARTGANLKGALVTIDEVGQSTSTDDIGRYQFPAIQSGDYTIRVSYLGYGEQSIAVSVRGNPVAEDFALIGGSELEEIVVFGQRSARAQSLNLERTAANSTTVLAADLLGQFNGTTISEALRRAPGIAFIPDPDTGDGSQVIVRGLEPDLNQVTLNGVRLLDGTGLGRSPDLSNILTESIDSVTINKSLLPSHDSNGAGALIEIKTKSPLDRAERFASFGLEYGEQGGDFGDEYGINGTASGVFGANKEFGLSLSASYRERDVTRISYSISGTDPAILPATNSVGDSVRDEDDIDPRRSFPFESDFGRVYPGAVTSSQGDSEEETFSLIGAAQKRFGSHTDLKLDVVYSENTTTTYRATTAVYSSARYDLAPVDALGGEVRPSMVAEDVARNNPDLADRRGPGIAGSIGREIYYNPDQESSTLAVGLAGETIFDVWEIDYRLGYSRSEDQNPGTVFVDVTPQAFDRISLGGSLRESVIGDRSFFTSQALSNITGDGRLVSIFPALQSDQDSGYLLPLFSEAGFAFYNSEDGFPLFGSTRGGRKSEGEERNARLAIRRGFQHNYVKYLKLGVEYRDNEFFSPADFGQSALGGGSFRNADDSLSSDLGLIFGPSILSEVGAAGGFKSITRDSVEAFWANITQLEENELLIFSERTVNDRFSRSTSEEFLTGFIEAEITLGDLQIIGGARIERLEIASRSFNSPLVYGPRFQVLIDPLEFGEFRTESATQTDVLPRFLINYRFTENSLLRGSYYMTSSRPQLANLTQNRNITYSIPGAFARFPDGLLTVTEGNPELKPAVTHSFGLDWEWYTNDIGVIKVATFYKRIVDPLQSNRVLGGLEILPSDLTLPDISFFNEILDTADVNLTRPVNGEDDSEIWGLELTAERQLTFLPGIWSGLGIYSNYAYTDSKSVQRFPVFFSSFAPEGFIEIEDVPFEGSPKHQGTFGLTYSKHSIDASLLYSMQARRLASIATFGFDNYDEAFETLDFRADYFTEVNGSTVRFFVRAEDLLNGAGDSYLRSSIGGERGVPKYYTGATYFGGRSFFGGISVSF